MSRRGWFVLAGVGAVVGLALAVAGIELVIRVLVDIEQEYHDR